MQCPAACKQCRLECVVHSLLAGKPCRIFARNLRNGLFRGPLLALGNRPWKIVARAIVPASIIAKGTAQIFRHWNLSSAEYRSITIPANCEPRKRPTPVVAAKIKACIELRIDRASHRRRVDLADNHEHHVRQAVEYLGNDDQPLGAADDLLPCETRTPLTPARPRDRRDTMFGALCNRLDNGRRDVNGGVHAFAGCGTTICRDCKSEGKIGSSPLIHLDESDDGLLGIADEPQVSCVPGPGWYSYLGREIDQQMRSYFTPEAHGGLPQASAARGVSTRTSGRALGEGRRHAAAAPRAGANMQLICLHLEARGPSKTIEDTRPIAVSHHGGATDHLFREGHAERVHDFVKAVHDEGLLAGVSAHNPDCIKRIAEQGWEVDFFMTCFYYLTRPKMSNAGAKKPPVLAGPDVGYSFLQTDPLAMTEVVRQVKQPCLGFKSWVPAVVARRRSRSARPDHRLHPHQADRRRDRGHVSARLRSDPGQLPVRGETG